MHNYLSLVKQHVKDDYAVIIIDNSDIAKPVSRKMPLPVYEKIFSAAKKGFISETHENLCCLQSLSENFSTKCVRTLDRRFDANDYYRYFLKYEERFVIRAKKNRNVIYNGGCNIIDVALRYNGAYCISNRIAASSYCRLLVIKSSGFESSKPPQGRCY